MRQPRFLLPCFATLAALALSCADASAAAFTAGNIAVYRVGTGTAATSSASAAVFIDEYTPGGTLVQSIAMPTAANGANAAFTASGSATSEGLLTRSTDGRYLALTGYAAAPGVASISGTAAATTPRVAGLVDANGVIDTTTALTDFTTGNNPRSAITVDGSQVWVAGGASGVRYAARGATTSTQIAATPANFRQLEIFGSQLYVDTSSGSAVRLGAIGSGLPTTTGQIVSALPGLPVSTGSPYAYALVHLSAGAADFNTLYLADDAAGLLKYSLVGSTWTANGAVTGKYRGLAFTTSGDNVTLYLSIDGELDTLTDSSGFNATISATPTKIASAATNTFMRGVALVPVNPQPHATLSTPSDFGSVNVGASSSAQAITVSNDGAADLHVSAITPSGDFSVTTQTCTAAPVAVGTSCRINVQFSPTTAGARSGSLAISSDSNPAAVAATLSGTGVALPQYPHAMLSSASDFGSVNVGSSSAPQTISVSNDGNADLHITAVNLSGDFSLTADNCSGVTVVANASCTFGIVFAPTSGGARSGSVGISSDSNPAATTQTLNGTGVAQNSHATLSMPNDFGSVTVGSSSAAQTITVSSDGNIDLHITALALSGDFSATADSCSGTTVTVGNSCTFGIVFTPSTGGVRTGSAGISSDSNPAATAASLSGTGIVPPSPVIAGLPSAFSGVIGDPTDYTFGAYARGLDFTIGEGNDSTPCSDIIVSASSSNSAVVPVSGLIIDPCMVNSTDLLHGITALHIDPASEGYADITLTATDSSNRTSTTVLHYAASTAWSAPGVLATIWPTGDADSSAAQPLGSDYTLIGGDENQVLRIYSRLLSGSALAGTDVTPSLGLTGTPDDYEVDIEATAIDPATPNRVYWAGSHGNSKKGNRKPNRERIFATDLSGSGAATTLSVTGYYEHMRDDLVAWDHGNLHGLGVDFLGLAASSYTDANGSNGIPPKSIDGFNIEGMSFSPDGSVTWLGFRAPLLPASGPAANASSANPRNRALLVPMTNFATLASGAAGHATGQALFGAPILLDLGGLGVREIKCNSYGCLIAAGPFDGTDDMGALYTWSGNAADAPVRRTANLVGLNAEGIVELPNHALTDSDIVELVSDEGSRNFYDPTLPPDGDDGAAKALPYDSWKNSASIKSSWVSPTGFSATVSIRIDGVRRHQPQ